MDRVTAVACAAMLVSACCSAADLIAVNQLGYRPGDRNVAFANGECRRFVVLDASGRRVFTGSAVMRTRRSMMSGDTVYELDFTRLAKPGTYRIRAEGFDQSYPFGVSHEVYREALARACRFYYFQRCGTPLLREHAGPWSRETCHQREGERGRRELTFKSGRPGRMDGSGGWHDAGDYNRYNPYHAYVAGIMMLAHESFPDRFDDASFNIPESGNRVPDILDEAKWGLDWLLKMQRDDGGMYHQVHDERWIGVRAAEVDENTRYVVDTVSAEDTAQATAAFAIAARAFAAYERVYAGFADRCRRAALRGWAHVTSHRYDPRGPGGDLDCVLWACAELFKTTGDPRFGRFIKKSCADMQFNGSWTSLYHCDVQLLGMYSYASTQSADPGVRDIYVERMTALAESREAAQLADGYACSLTHYPWMSNAFALGDAMLFLVTDRLTGGRKRFTQCAVDNVSYILGRNCHNTCFVTGLGSKSPRYPFHQPSMADGIDLPVPGIMVGGPNQNRRQYFRTRFPARAWADNGYALHAPKKDLKNYYYQEPSIAASAPLVFVTAALSSNGRSVP